MKKALSHVKSHLISCPQFTHPRTLPERWRLSAAVQGDLQVNTLKCEACLTGVFSTSCIVTCIFIHTNCKLCSLWMIRTKRYTYNLVIIFRENLLKIQTCWTTFWWVMTQIFICMAQLISRTVDTGQMRIVTNFTNILFMIQNLLFGVLFGPEESMDPTSLRMKMGKPSQSHHNVTQRWSMNFWSQSVHQNITCCFNKMVLWPTQQWSAWLCFTFCFHSG